MEFTKIHPTYDFGDFRVFLFQTGHLGKMWKNIPQFATKVVQYHLNYDLYGLRAKRQEIIFLKIHGIQSSYSWA